MEILRQKYHHPRNDDHGDEHDNVGDDNKSLENVAEYDDGDERGERG